MAFAAFSARDTRNLLAVMILMTGGTVFGVSAESPNPRGWIFHVTHHAGDPAVLPGQRKGGGVFIRPDRPFHKFPGPVTLQTVSVSFKKLIAMRVVVTPGADGQNARMKPFLKCPVVGVADGALKPVMGRKERVGGLIVESRNEARCRPLRTGIPFFMAGDAGHFPMNVVRAGGGDDIKGFGARRPTPTHQEKHPRDRG